MKESFWNPDRVKLLHTQWLEGATGSKIAAVLGCTRSAVMGKISRLRRKARLDEAPRAIIVAARKPKRRYGRLRSGQHPTSPPAPRKPIPPPSIIEGGVALLDLKPDHCRAVVGHDGYLARFCGINVTTNVVRGQPKTSAYCAGHHAEYHQIGA